MKPEYILSQMGYRQDHRSGVWAKPVGTNLFLFDVDTMEWENRFLALNGKFSCWQRHSVPDHIDTDYAFFRTIQKCEAWTRINVAWDGQPDFRLGPDFSVVDPAYNPTGFPEEKT